MNAPQRPWSIQLELTEGCNYACWFCGIHAIREKSNWNVYRHMDLDMLRSAFRELNAWVGKIRVEINNHGEPTLHPKLVHAIAIIRQEMPRAQIQIQTNGSTIEDARMFANTIDLWFASGANLICVNAYKRWWRGPENLPPDLGSRYDWFMYLAQEHARAYPDVTAIDMYHDNPKRVSMYHYHGPKVKYLMVLDDLGEVNQQDRADSGRPVSKDICNEAGNTPAKPLEKLLQRPTPPAPLQKKCTRPFRELILSWDGHVPVCCYDWSSQIVLGKFPDWSLQDIWEARTTNVVRELLMRKNRNMTPCNVCDYNGGWRQGLLQPPGLTDTDASLQAELAEHMRRHRRFVEKKAPIVIGVHELKKASRG